MEGLNRFHGANLPLCSDVDKNTQMFGLQENPIRNCQHRIIQLHLCDLSGIVIKF